MPKVKTQQIAETGGYFISNGKDGKNQAQSSFRTSLNSYSYDEMRQHPTLCAGMSQIKSPILSTNYFVSGESEEIKNFLTENLKILMPELLNDMLYAFDYGWSPFEKIYQVKNGKVYFRKMSPLTPLFVQILTNEFGEFAGIRSQLKTQVDISKDGSAVFTYNKQYGDAYGVSRYRSARYPYNVHKFILEMCSMFYESYADPRYVIKAPQGKTKNPITDKITDNIQFVSDKMENLNNGGAKNITLPAFPDGQAQYDVKILESGRTGADYINYLEYLDSRMLQAILIPSLSVMPSDRGSFALMKEISQSFAFQYDSELQNIKKFIELEIFNPLLSMNFGVEYVGKYEWSYMPMTKRDQDLLRNSALAGIQANKVKPDWEWLGNQLGLPLEENDTIEEVAKAVEDKKAVQKQSNEMEHSHPVHIKFEKTKREQSAYEKQHINYPKIKSMFEKSKPIFNKLDAVLDDIKINFLTELKTAINSGDAQAISKLQLSFKDKYANLFVKENMTTFEEAVQSVRDELALGGKPIDADTALIQKTKARIVADTQLGEIESGVKLIAIGGLADGKKFSEIENDLKNYLVDYKDSIKLSAEVTLKEFIDDGRRYGADDPEVATAMWSAILDDVTCPLCEQLDGMITDVGSAEYEKYSATDLHPNCRCIWVYTLKNETNIAPADWVDPSQTLQDKYIRPLKP